MESHYSSQEIEKEILDFWVKNDLFVPKEDFLKTKKTYAVLMPPPNITNVLHLGHALNNTVQDVMIRYHRMIGEAALWKVGVDHAGIATENMVEKDLLKQGLSKKELGKEKFLDKVWEWKERYGNIIVDQLKKIGSSGDWNRLRFTMDTVSQEAVNEIFVQLYKDGLIYRAEYIVNWCVHCLTALSDEEVEHVDDQGEIYSIKYFLKDTDQFLVIDTTRPETIFGDVAVAVHPQDKRYQSFIGKEVLVPLQNHIIPVIADELVEMNFGTGVLKVTPFHDATDFAIGKKHDLPLIEIMDQQGVMTQKAGILSGKERFQARKEMLQLLKDNDLLQEIKTHHHSRGVCYRCANVVEQRVSKQWFVKMQPLAKPALEAMNQEKLHFTPKKWEKVYRHWLKNIKDWCISRQIWWGHRIPAYHCQSCGKISVSKDPLEECSFCHHHSLQRDPDVLDTWFSSWIWPLTTFDWPLGSSQLEKYYPTQFLATAPEIIFFWVARMVMAGIYITGKIPFSHVFFNSTICDMKGKKMSKSLGNGIDPLEIVQEYGADALRFTLLFLAPKGERIRLEKKSFELGYKFINKLWNASRFILQQKKVDLFQNPFELNQDDWDHDILIKLQNVSKKIEECFKKFDYFEMSHLLYHFFWNDFCDWYLESSKDKMNSEDSSIREAKYAQIVFVLDQILRLLHPMIPFITEYIWQQIPNNQGKNLITAPYFQKIENLLNQKSQQAISLIQDFITKIRNIKVDLNLNTEKVDVLMDFESQEKKFIFMNNKNEIQWLAKLGSLQENSLKDSLLKNHLVFVERQYLFAIQLPPNFDKQKEKQRLLKELEIMDSEINRANDKLKNQKFIQFAQEDLVFLEQKKLEDYKAKKVRTKYVLTLIN